MTVSNKNTPMRVLLWTKKKTTTFVAAIVFDAVVAKDHILR
jgi:hypothetical protein